MSGKTEKYMLVDGKHGRHDADGNLVIYRAGVKGHNVLSLSKKEARALGKKVRPLSAIRAELAAFEDDIEDDTEDVLQEEVVNAGEVVEEEEEEDAEGEDEWDFSEMTGPDVITVVNSLESVEELEEALESEKEGKNRITVLNAINHRIETIEAEE